MPVSKNRRIKRKMKPRTFATAKSARRYLRRFKWDLQKLDWTDGMFKETIIAAKKIIGG